MLNTWQYMYIQVYWYACIRKGYRILYNFDHAQTVCTILFFSHSPCIERPGDEAGCIYMYMVLLPTETSQKSSTVSDVICPQTQFDTWEHSIVCFY